MQMKFGLSFRLSGFTEQNKGKSHQSSPPSQKIIAHILELGQGRTSTDRKLASLFQ